MPKTTLGKWSVGLQIVFVITMIASIVLVKGAHVLNFDDRWWDVTVGVMFPLSLIAGILGAIAMWKQKDRSVLVLLSVLFGVALVIFILLHSLFIAG